MNHWAAGDQIVYREVWQGAVWTAKPVTVVQDHPDLIVLYLCGGTHWKQCVPLHEGDSLLTCLLAGRWQLVDAIWPWDTLTLVQPGAAHSVHIMRGEGKGSTEFKGWYINLEEPLRRTETSLDFMDQELDIVVKPDLSEWVWKDEDDLQSAFEAGRFTLSDVRAIRAEAERVIERIQAKVFPFNAGWERWVPPPEWPVPGLPAGWDR